MLSKSNRQTFFIFSIHIKINEKNKSKMLTKRQEIIPFIAVCLWFVALWFGFIAVNVNYILGVIYLAVFTIVSMILYTWDKVKTTPLDRTGQWFMPAIQGVLLYVGFILLSTLLVPFFEEIPIGQLIQLIGTTTPALAQSQILNTLTFVIFVPFAETMFFIISMDFLASTGLRLDISRKGIFKFSTIALVFFLSFIFMLYHVTAKGVTNNIALMLVFLMMLFTLFATIWFGEAKQAIFFHMIANACGLGLLTGVII